MKDYNMQLSNTEKFIPTTETGKLQCGECDVGQQREIKASKHYFFRYFNSFPRSSRKAFQMEKLIGFED